MPDDRFISIVIEKALGHSEVPQASTGSPDDLANRFLGIADDYKRLRLNLEIIRTEIEFAIRHLSNLPTSDPQTRSLLINRLTKAVELLDQRMTADTEVRLPSKTQ